MTTYVFSTMTADQAANFDADGGADGGDELLFITGTPGDVNVVFTPGNNLTADSITLSVNGVSRTFGAAQLAGVEATFAEDADADLVIGSSGDDAALAVDNGATSSAVYGFGGGDDIVADGGSSDTIFGGAGDDSITGASVAPDEDTDPADYEVDFYFGGAGKDSIEGGNGNDHIYGDGITPGTGTSLDIGDQLDGNAGNDFIQGNAGDDTITGGEGNDFIRGGANDDDIEGNEGQDTIRGDKGDDTIDGGSENDFIRGGADDDTLLGNTGNDVIYGDNGDDTITGGAGIDIVAGDNPESATISGDDTFVFAASSATFSYGEENEEDDDYLQVDQILDFQLYDSVEEEGDTLVIANIDTVESGGDIAFTDVEAAITYANGLIDGAANTAAAVQVGADTYLFYASAGTVDAVINSAIKLYGVDASDVDEDSLNLAPIV